MRSSDSRGTFYVVRERSAGPRDLKGCLKMDWNLAQWLDLLGVTSQGHIGQSPEHPECPTRWSEAVAPLRISGDGSCIVCLLESVQGDLACRKVNLTKWQMASALIERSLLKSISFSSQLLRLKGVTLHEAHSLLIPFFKASNFVAFVQHLSMFIPQTR